MMISAVKMDVIRSRCALLVILETFFFVENTNSIIVIKKGIISKANGSCYMELGGTKLTCAIYGPRSTSGRTTASKAYSPLGSVNCEIEFAPFSQTTRRPYSRDAEEAEMSEVLASALEPAVRRELFPNAHVDVFVTVLQDDGAVMAAAIMAASAALAQAQLEMFDSVVACSALVHQSMVLVDPTKTELGLLQSDPASKCLMTVAYMPNLNRITQIHSVGPLTPSLYQEALNMVLDGSKAAYQSTLRPTLISQ